MPSEFDMFRKSKVEEPSRVAAEDPKQQRSYAWDDWTDYYVQKKSQNQTESPSTTTISKPAETTTTKTFRPQTLAEAKMLARSKQIQKQTQVERSFESLSPAVKMFSSGKTPEQIVRAAKTEERLRKESPVYDIGYRLGKVSEDISKKVEDILPLERYKIGGVEIGKTAERVAGIYAGGIPFVGSVILEGLGVAQAAVKGVRPENLGEETISNLKGFAQSEAERFRQKPVETGLEYAALFLGPELAGRGLGYVSRGIESVTTFRGKEFIPIEKLTQPEVVEGKIAFPKPERPGSGESIRGEFYRSPSLKQTDIGKAVEPSGFHASPMVRGPRGLGKGYQVHDVVKRSKDVPGQYIAPHISPHFLRNVGETSGYTIVPRLPRVFKRPGVIQVGLKGVERLPDRIRYDVQAARQWLKTEAEKGKAYVTPSAEKGALESEAVIAPYTQVENIRGTGLFGGKFKYYTEIRGKKIPIYEAEVVDSVRRISKLSEDFKKQVSRDIKPYRDFMEEYSLKPAKRWIGRDIRGLDYKSYRYEPDRYIFPYRYTRSRRSEYRFNYRMPEYKTSGSSLIYEPSGYKPPKYPPSYRPLTYELSAYSPSYIPPSYKPPTYPPVYKPPVYKPPVFPPVFTGSTQKRRPLILPKDTLKLWEFDFESDIYSKRWVNPVATAEEAINRVIYGKIPKKRRRRK